MSFFAQFSSRDLLDFESASEVVPAWDCIWAGDVVGASLKVLDFSEAQIGVTAFAQLNAGIALLYDDLEAAVDILQTAIPKVVDPRQRSSLAFQLAICAAASGKNLLAQESYDLAYTYQELRLETALSRAEFLWGFEGVDSGRSAFELAIERLNVPELWAAWARLERKIENPINAKIVLDRALEAHSGHPDILLILAAWYIAASEFSKALDVLDSMPSCFSTHSYVLINRGNAYLGLQRFKEASQVFNDAIGCEQNLLEVRIGLATAEFSLDNDGVAEEQLLKLLELDPDYVDGLVLLSRVYSRSKRKDEAKDLLVKAIDLDADCYSAHYLLAEFFRNTAAYEEAELHIRKALELRPENMALYDLLGIILLSSADLSSAYSAFRFAMEKDFPAVSSCTSNFLFSQHYDASATAEDLFSSHQSFGVRFGGQLEDLSSPFVNLPDPNRRLRIGYVSADFRMHSVSYFMQGIIAVHDYNAFEIFVYHNSEAKDATSQWFEDHVDCWRDVSGKTYDDVRKIIREDRIDILVDLSGHTGGNLLPMFARRAAPVQVSYLGYPNTTGVPAIDYRIVDHFTDPDDAKVDTLAVEKLFRLPKSFLCYAPLSAIPSVADGPLANGLPMTFGSFNAIVKLNAKVYDVWSEILLALPQSRLLLKARELLSPRVKLRVTAEFEARGVDRSRLQLVAFTSTLGEHLDLYGQVDLALDTFPYNGTTTTCEAMSMGVPVLTLKGNRHSARVGESLMHSVGLVSEFLAENEDDYIQRAIAFAGRRRDLHNLRHALRPKMAASVLCDREGFTHDLEEAYRTMWREWCEGDKGRYSLTPSAFEVKIKEECKKSSF